MTCKQCHDRSTRSHSLLYGYEDIDAILLDDSSRTIIGLSSSSSHHSIDGYSFRLLPIDAWHATYDMEGVEHVITKYRLAAREAPAIVVAQPPEAAV
jgi:hypothetical protein